MLFPNILHEKLKHILHQVHIFILNFQMFQKITINLTTNFYSLKTE